MQTIWKRLWQSVKGMSAKDVKKRAYHDDDMAQQDWRSVVEGHAPSLPTPKTESPTAQRGLDIEYLNQVFFKKNHYYAVPIEDSFVDESGVEQVRQGNRIFQVVDTTGSHSRPHVVSTYTSVDELYLTASLALLVQPLAIVPVTAENVVDAPVGGGHDMHRVSVFPDGDTEWINALDLAPMKRLTQELQSWRREEPSRERVGAIVLSDWWLARPTMTPLADNCPTLCVIRALLNAKWTEVKHKVVHTMGAIGATEFDSRAATRMKRYFQTLLELRKCLAYTSAVPSQEPIHFYDLLRAGKRVEPGLGAKHYLALWNNKRVEGGDAPLPLEDDAPRPLQYDADDGIITDLPAPKPKAKPRAANPARRGGGGGRGRGAPGPPLPLGPPVCPSGRGGGGDPDPPPPAPPREPSPPPLPPPRGPSPAVHDDDVLGDDPAAPAARRGKRRKRDDAPDFIDGIGGFLVKYDEYRLPATGELYKNWIIKCKQVGHRSDCGRSRKCIEPHMRNYGVVEPIAFLHVWAALVPRPDSTHAKTTPTDAQVAAFVHDHNTELQELCSRYGLM